MALNAAMVSASTSNTKETMATVIELETKTRESTDLVVRDDGEGEPPAVTTKQVEVQINQLYGGQEKFALLEVEVPAGKAKENKLGQMSK